MDESNNKYKLQYLPIFYEDLYDKVTYILEVLNNKDAANELVNAIENAIIKRLPIAESFEKYQSRVDRTQPYYRIFIGNFVIYYVVIEDETQGKIMEIRRFLYNRQNRDRIL